jgi:hypothetical protein
VAATPSAPGAVAGRFTYAPGTYHYEVRTDASVELAGTRERESVGTVAHLAYTVARDARGVAIAGQVDSVAVQASARVAGDVTARPSAPVRFRGTVDPTPPRAGQTARGAALELVGGGPRCTLPEGAVQAAALAAAREAVVRVPASIAVGTQWRDSTTAPGCSGEIATAVTVVSRYEVVGQATVDGTPAARLRRETSVTVRGQGFARGQPVVVTGTGAGSGSVYVDAAGGRVLGGESETRSTVRVIVGREPAREFAQHTKTRMAMKRDR